jgi:hypothetical protein
MKSLEQVRKTLMAALGSEALSSLVITRIALQTGVDLKRITPDADNDSALVTRVLEALRAMGYTAEQLTVVAKRNEKK